MRTSDATGNYRAPASPCTRNLKPYLTYELDQVRKQHEQQKMFARQLQLQTIAKDYVKRLRAAQQDQPTRYTYYCFFDEMNV